LSNSTIGSLSSLFVKHDRENHDPPQHPHQAGLTIILTKAGAGNRSK
jgi:glucan phosphoethanolaminetransferase (alkaline phosphatase superfamily)